MKRLILLTVFILSIMQHSFAQHQAISSTWVLDNIELSDFAETEHAFTEQESFFAYFLDKTKTLDLSQSSLSLMVNGESYSYELELNKKELRLSASNTVYIKKNDQPVETKLAIGETVFNIKQEGDKLMLTRKNETFYERYTFIATK